MEIRSLTITERAVLANQHKIFALLDKKNAKEHLLNAEVFENGYSGLYEEVLDNISEEIPREVCDETTSILVMFKHIQQVVHGLDKSERLKLNLDRIRFDGFDADNDDHYYFAKFMIRKKHFYEHFSHLKMNSHSQASLLRYRKMLPVYRDLLEEQADEWGKNELAELIEAAHH
jgi:uncharacterized protein YfbU (UPF0304 family)